MQERLTRLKMQERLNKHLPENKTFEVNLGERYPEAIAGEAYMHQTAYLSNCR